SRRIDRPAVDFPQPDSPTIPKASPSSTLKDTSCSACSLALRDPMKPCPTRKVLERLRTSRRAVMRLHLGETGGPRAPSNVRGGQDDRSPPPAAASHGRIAPSATGSDR